MNLANCCNPVYGDSIVGYITKGKGITVHRMNCHNLNMLEDRTLEVSWNKDVNPGKRYLSFLLVYTKDTENHMLDLVQTISALNVSVDGIKIMSKGENSVYEISFYVTGLEQLEKLIIALQKNTYVEKAERTIR